MSDKQGSDVAQGMMVRQPAAVSRWRMAPTSLGEAMEMAQLISGSDLCPKAYRGRPQDCIVAYEYGSALGLSWMQSLRSVSVINGQAALWGDAVPALIYASGECERFHEFFEGEKGSDTYTAVCIMKRRGMPDEVRRTFSVADAKKAGLWTKSNTPWQTYPDRMLQMRARGFGARDTFADKLSGLILAEEAMDYPAIDAHVVSSEVVQGQLEQPKVLTLFAELPEPLRDSIEKGFAELNIANGARLAKLNEFLGNEKGTTEENAVQLQGWLKDEWARRKTGKPRAPKGNGNAKEKKETEGAAPLASTVAHSEPKTEPVAQVAASDPSVGQGQPAAKAEDEYLF